jgi:hypothetical protein
MEQGPQGISSHPMAWKPNNFQDAVGLALGHSYVVQVDEQGVAGLEENLENFKSQY